MELVESLRIRPGITAVIGGGGKTTLLRTLGEELSKKNRVLLCTSTKIMPFSGIPCAKNEGDLHQLRNRCHLICAGRELPESGKLTASEVSFSQLAEWFDYVLVEADGSAQHPLKAHAPHEPVIPAESNQTICVVGASGFGRPIVEVVHRPEVFVRLTGASLQDNVTAEMVATVLKAENLHHRVYMNQTETLLDLIEAKALAGMLDCPVLAGSLQRREYFQC